GRVGHGWRLVQLRSGFSERQGHHLPRQSCQRRRGRRRRRGRHRRCRPRGARRGVTTWRGRREGERPGVGGWGGHPRLGGRGGAASGSNASFLSTAAVMFSNNQASGGRGGDGGKAGGGFAGFGGDGSAPSAGGKSGAGFGGRGGPGGFGGDSSGGGLFNDIGGN